MSASSTLLEGFWPQKVELILKLKASQDGTGSLFARRLRLWQLVPKDIINILENPS